MSYYVIFHFNTFFITYRIHIHSYTQASLYIFNNELIIDFSENPAIIKL